MRLIDADELKRLGYVLTRTYPKDPQTMVYETKNIDDIPTIDPVRHGRWKVRLDARRFCECSICGFRPEYKYNYCPNCGSRMEANDDHE